MQLHRGRPALEAAGGRLVVIGNGRPHYIAGFRDKSGYDGELYTDPSGKSYRALRLRRGVRATFSPQGVRRGLKAALSGMRQTSTQGDPWQQGGVFVVDTAGDIAFRYPSEFAGDHPPTAHILAALRAAA